MNIKWYGHSCFRIRFDNNTTLLTDPYNAESYGNDLTYSMDFENVDIITISHQHNDHNYKPKGNAKIIEEAGDYNIKGIKIQGIKTYHDKHEGAERGPNTIFIYQSNGKKIAHLGDLGDIPGKKIFDQLKDADIVFIPIGGTFTIEPELAKEIIDNVKPSLIFPMHYKTDKVKFPIKTTDEFVKYFEKDRILYIEKSDIDINDNFYNKIIILKYS